MAFFLSVRRLLPDRMRRLVWPCIFVEGTIVKGRRCWRAVRWLAFGITTNSRRGLAIFYFTNQHTLITLERGFLLRLHVGSLALSPGGRELTSLTFTAASYTRRRAGVIDTYINEAKTSIPSPKTIKRDDGCGEGGEGRLGSRKRTSQVAFDLSFATRIASLIAPTMLSGRCL